MGEPTYFLGMEISRDSMWENPHTSLAWKSAETLKLSQTKYLVEVVKRGNMTECKPANVPLPPGTKLRKEGTDLQKPVPYSELVGCLMYAAHCTRPDLAHSVNMLVLSYAYRLMHLPYCN